MNNDNLVKGKGNGQRKAYDHLTSTGIFGVAEKIKEARKSNFKNKRRK